jgi:hypothetical protein
LGAPNSTPTPPSSALNYQRFQQIGESLGLITLKQIIAALVHAIETPAHGVKIMEVPEIRHCC